jgi:hypothetical protein
MELHPDRGALDPRQGLSEDVAAETKNGMGFNK